ncbi:GTP:AMP phosphotransferase AK3, mitochondrial-like [Watersipora subatra]|uniref:GTP:AMP phosphotransferase AK3, mitochondrial-like n=1 Tax=Watersipora subatra TaxID=2589382 RepID=UPI00355C22A6
MAAARTLLKAVIMGPPGSGKGTIAERIVKDFGLKHLASGDLLRSQVMSKTDVGMLADKYITRGDLVPDDVMLKLILNELQGEQLRSAKWLLDGFPRTIPQCEGLLNTIQLDVVINLDVPFDEIINRVKDRYIHESSGRIYNLVFNPPKVAGQDDITGEPLIQRHDDKAETVAARLDNYKKKTEPVLDYFSKRELLINFPGRFSNEIWPRVHTELSRYVQPLQYTEYK